MLFSSTKMFQIEYVIILHAYFLSLLLLSTKTHAISNVKQYYMIEDDCKCVPKALCLDNESKVNGEGVLDVR